MSRSMGEKVAGERGEGVEGRGMQEEKEEEEARYDFFHSLGAKWTKILG